VELQARTLTDGESRWHLPHHVTASISVIDSGHPDHPAHGLVSDDFEADGDPWPTVTRIELRPPESLKALKAPRRFRRHVTEIRPGVLVSARAPGENRRSRSQSEKRRGRILYRSPAEDPSPSSRLILGFLSIVPGAAIVEEVGLLTAPHDGAAKVVFGTVCFSSAVAMDLITDWHARQPPWLRRAVWAAPSAAVCAAGALLTLR
jgi:hypothetical protein